MSILRLTPPISRPMHSVALSSSASISGQVFTLRVGNLPQLSAKTAPQPVIRMGGGPRTYPGGVSKWQWKRMQAKKAKQLLKARLARERQIYEMRKRAELKAAVSELERPWEVVREAPTLFSVSADEQLKVLADRFQKPGGFDLWSEKDGPELFKPDERDFPSSRFFPKGVVHSIKPYEKTKRIEGGYSKFDELSDSGGEFSGREGEEVGDKRKVYNGELQKVRIGSGEAEKKLGDVGPKNVVKDNRISRRGNRRRWNSEDSQNYGENSGGRNRGQVDRTNQFRSADNDLQRFKGSNSEVFDLSMREDGRYELQSEI